LRQAGRLSDNNNNNSLGRSLSFSAAKRNLLPFPMFRSAIGLGRRAFVRLSTLFQEQVLRRNNKDAENASNKMADKMGPKVPKKIVPLDEAYQILNVTKSATRDQIQTNFDKMFKANDVENGGSFYIQSKLVRAKERIDAHLATNPVPTARSPNQAASPTSAMPKNY